MLDVSAGSLAPPLSWHWGFGIALPNQKEHVDGLEEDLATMCALSLPGSLQRGM